MTRQQDLEKIDSLKREIEYLRIRDNNKTADILTLELQLLEDKVKSKSKSNSNSEKIDYDEIAKYLPPRDDDPNVIIDDSLAKQRVLSAINAKRAEEDYQRYIKRQEEEQRIMKEREEQRRERRKREQEIDKNFLKRQFEMLLSAKYPKYYIGSGFGGNYPISMKPAFVGIPPKVYQQQGAGIKVTSIEPALNYLREKWPSMIEVDEQTHNRLEEFAKPDETWKDLMNRLLDIVAEVQAQTKPGTDDNNNSNNDDDTTSLRY